MTTAVSVGNGVGQFDHAKERLGLELQVPSMAPAQAETLSPERKELLRGVLTILALGAVDEEFRHRLDPTRVDFGPLSVPGKAKHRKDQSLT